MLGINIGQNNFTNISNFWKVKVLIPGLIHTSSHTSSIYDKSFCTFLETLKFSAYFSYVVFHLMFTTLLGEWEKVLFLRKI